MLFRSELYRFLNPLQLIDKEAMESGARYLVEQVKRRKETDNISVIIIKGA